MIRLKDKTAGYICFASDTNVTSRFKDRFIFFNYLCQMADVSHPPSCRLIKRASL